MSDAAAWCYSADLVKRQIEVILERWRIEKHTAARIAAVMIETDLSGVDSHGVSMMPLYDKMVRAGQINVNAVPRVLRETATTALIDGDAGFGHCAALQAMELAIEKSAANDVAVVSVFNSHHFGAAGYYAEMAADRRLIAIVASSARFVTLVPTFGAQAVLGTNPLAFMAPAGRHSPVLLDMATSVVAANKIRVNAVDGKDLPEGWVVDGEGRAVTDASDATRLLFETLEGGLAPMGGIGKLFGGHKGYGLALFAQIFGSTLGGGSFSPVRNATQQASDPDNIGHFFLCINPTAFRPWEQYATDMDMLIDTLRETKPIDPTHPVLIPGDPERNVRAERKQGGIPIPEALRLQLKAIACGAGAPFLLDQVQA